MTYFKYDSVVGVNSWIYLDKPLVDSYNCRYICQNSSNRFLGIIDKRTKGGNINVLEHFNVLLNCCYCEEAMTHKLLGAY